MRSESMPISNQSRIIKRQQIIELINKYNKDFENVTLTEKSRRKGNSSEFKTNNEKDDFTLPTIIKQQLQQYSFGYPSILQKKDIQ